MLWQFLEKFLSIIYLHWPALSLHYVTEMLILRCLEELLQN